MRKTNAALLEEISNLDAQVRVLEDELKDSRRGLAQFAARMEEKDAEIKWLKRIIEGLVSAPSITTRLR